MALTHRFPSLTAPEKRAYVYDTAYCDSIGRFHAVNEHMRFYETYGDGMTQHSPSVSIPVEMMTDYLFSLASAMLADKELRDAANYAIRAGMASDADLEFAFSVKWKEGKDRWYSRQERKVSAHAEKRHDKRYELVTEHFKGDIDSAFRVMWRDYYRGMESFALMYSVLKYAERMEKTGFGCVATHLKWELGDDRYSLDRAFECCWSLIQAYDHIDHAERGVKGYLRNLEQAKETSDAA
jgi:hypothetical protein